MKISLAVQACNYAPAHYTHKPATTTTNASLACSLSPTDFCLPVHGHKPKQNKLFVLVHVFVLLHTPLPTHVNTGHNDKIQPIIINIME